MMFGNTMPGLGRPSLGIMHAECLFSGPLPLLFRPSLNSSDDVRRSETVVIELTLIPASSSKRVSSHLFDRQALEIKLTDREDPFFLWQSIMTEEDYFALKREQQLVVDFIRFPSFLVGLIEKCQQYIIEERPLFGAYFWAEQQQAVLSFVETNEFKQNNYVVLRMSPVSETALKKHLSGLLHNYKDEINSLRTTNVFPRGLGSAVPHSSHGSSTPHAGSATNVMNKSTVNYVERCKTLEERLVFNEQQLRELQEGKARLETDAAELRGQLKTLSSENERLKQEIYSFKSSVQGAGISARLAGLEQLVKEKDEALSRMNDLVQETREAKAHLESNVSQLKAQIAAMYEGKTTSHSDLERANEAIRKLQEDLRNAKNKVRSSATLAQEQERLRREATSQFETVKNELEVLREQYNLKMREIGELEESKRHLQSELSNQLEVNEGLQKVIDWLHLQISDERINSIFRNEGKSAVLSEMPHASSSAPGPDNPPAQPSDLSSQYPLADEREVRNFFKDLGHQVGPDTSLPRFTPEELAEKQIESEEDMENRLDNLQIV